jgi:plastocyanin
MKSTYARLVMTVLAAGAVLAVASWATAAPATKLVATVGPGPTISVTKGGKKVTSLKPGKYSITVRDRSNFHNFHLTGPGVNRKTAVPEVRTRAWTLTFRRGTYRFVCDPHRLDMKGSFRVR